MPADIVIPFILWQLAVWSVLFGFFFLRTRGRYVQPKPRRSWNPRAWLRAPAARRPAEHVVPERH